MDYVSTTAGFKFVYSLIILDISGSFIPIPPPRTTFSTSAPLSVIMQHLLHGVALAFAGIFISFARYPPPPTSSQVVSWVYTAFVALFPAIYILDNQVYVYTPSIRRKGNSFYWFFRIVSANSLFRVRNDCQSRIIGTVRRSKYAYFTFLEA